MEGRKIELARLAAIGVVENLRPIDSVGVLIFDNSFQWAVPIRKAEDRSTIKKLISGITPDGGTQIAPALTEAYTKILPNQAIYKHIVLLTDGISEEGDSMNLTKEAKANHITISTVGLGQDVNRAFLEKVAQNADGKSYFLNDPSGLEQILLRDVEEHTGVTAVEKSIQVKAVKQAEILEGVGIESAPVLKGYVRFQARPTSDTILMADREDPLLVRWQYGLGRAGVFTSDAKNRWAANWVTWPGFDKLWANIFRDLLPHALASETSADFDRARDELVIDYRLAARRGRAEGTAGHLRDRPERIPDPDEGGQSGGRALPRPRQDREQPGALPHPAPGGFARLSGGRLLPPGRRDAGVRQQRAVAAADRGVHRGKVQPTPARRVRCLGPQRRHRDGSLARIAGAGDCC